jgi:hypothetical protein
MYSRQSAPPPTPLEIANLYDKGTVTWYWASAALGNYHGYTADMVIDLIGPEPGTTPNGNNNDNGDTNNGKMAPLPDGFMGFILLMMGLA